MKSESGLPNNLKATRTRLGLSQQQLAEAAHITRQTIGGIEAGQYAPSAAVALRLAKALGCRVEELFWLEEDLPTVEVLAAGNIPPGVATRVALAKVGERWTAHPLIGEAAFRAEMIPADGIALAETETGVIRVKLLDEPDSLARNIMLAGCTPTLSLWARSAERWHPGLRVHWKFANSIEALHCLARGEVHAAGIHLFDPRTGDDNARYARNIAGALNLALVHLGTWEEGFVVAPGNPRGISGVRDLAGKKITLVNREEGSGARLLLDRLLEQEGMDIRTVRGAAPIVCSHQEVARAILDGKADVGISAAAVATAYGLDFVPLQQTRYDLVLREESLRLEPMQQLLGTLHHRWIRSQLSVLGGFDTTQTGEITRLDR